MYRSRALPAWSTVAIVTLLLFVEILREVMTQSGLTRVDPSIADYVAQHRIDWLAALLSIVTWAGSSFVLVPLTIVIGVLSWMRWKRIRPLVLVGAAYGGATLSYAILKPAVGRLRPSAALQYGPPDTGWAFPSGHTTQSAAFYGMLAALLLASAVPHRRLLAAGAAAMVALIGFCRLYLGIHWLTDVLGGLALGLCWVAIVQLIAAATGRWQTR
ncbi:MAG: phosphatase PAP2 family protein [Candidatus Dormibacteraeota bacterium]|nr:phosphatase PAP2 family protein [Candidatus Dormibacteraeota bacterium]